MSSSWGEELLSLPAVGLVAANADPAQGRHLGAGQEATRPAGGHEPAQDGERGALQGWVQVGGGISVTTCVKIGRATR